jgi:hypothetical protein
MFSREAFEAMRDCTGAPGQEALLTAPLFACRRSTEGEEMACAGWLAAAGVEHLSGSPSWKDECLFEVDGLAGLVNRAAITAPGTQVRRLLAGCAGTFTPFSALDARRTALEAAELVGRTLSVGVCEGQLVTWRGEDTAFEREGYPTSRRAAVIPPGARVRVPAVTFAQPGCPVCSIDPAVPGGSA